MALHNSQSHPAPRPRRVTVLPPRPAGADGAVSGLRRSAPRDPSRVSTGIQLHHPPLRGIYPEPVRLPNARRQRTAHSALRRAFIRDVDPSAAETMPISRILVVIAVAFAFALLFGTRGIVHAGKGMQDGTERTVVLSVGDRLQTIADAVHLTAPWDGVEAALGRSQQPAIAPLLSAPPPVSPARSGSPDPPGSKRPGPAGAGTRLASATPSRPHVRKTHAAKLPALRVPTRAHPLRLLVTGDSLTEYLGPELVDEATRAGPVQGYTDTHYGTGLVRPDYVDWSVVARQQMSQYRPDAVVVMIGGNDFQNMTMANGKILYALTPAWIREYQRRAAVCMRIWARGGKTRVYWLSMPPARDASWSQNNANIDLALQRAARQVPGARYLNVLGPVTDHGKYSDYVYVNGEPVLVRTTDGIHFTEAGSQIIADEMMAILRHDWKIGARR